jgi:D-3-phosphoglycerate dehydrogenase / 2-oxoglutarate reductase
MPRVLITTEAVREVPGKHLDMLRAAGYDVRYPAKSVLLTEDETLEAMQGYVAVHAGGEPYTERVLAGLPELRVISRNGVGYDRIDVEAATRHGVAVAITPEGNHQAVAEHAMALMLAVARRVVQDSVDTRGGNWRRRKVFVPLRGSTLGIIGLGRIGRSVAVRAAAFGMRLLAFEQFPDQQFAQKHNVELVDLDTLLAQSDFVTLHTPMTPNTRELINRDTLAKMKRGSVLVNTARGGLVNEADLFAALKSGHLAGAGLDVLIVEPPPADHPLWELDNVIVTPHVAAFDQRALEDMAVAAAQNIIDLLDGRWPAASIVNPEVQSTFRR